MIIENLHSESIANKVRITASLDGFPLWYQVPESYKISRNGEAFLAAAILPAMLNGENIDIDPEMPVSGKFRDNLRRLQEIYHCWNNDLKIVDINTSSTSAETLNIGVASFFSGGVDSSYTLLRHLDEISHVVYISGFDFPFGDSGFSKIIDRNSSLIEKYNKSFINVETNFYQFGYKYNLSRNLTQGSCLGSITLLLGFNRFYIPSSYSYGQLFPLGSHPLTDPLWSNGSFEIVHDGCEATRTEKLQMILGEDEIMSKLSVCLHNNEENCGRCQKCVRTMVSLSLLDGSMSAFPAFPTLKEVRRREIDGQVEATFLKENIELAEAVGNMELRKALMHSLKRYERIRLYKHIDRVLAGGKIRGFYRKKFKNDKSVDRIDLKAEQF